METPQFSFHCPPWHKQLGERYKLIGLFTGPVYPYNILPADQVELFCQIYPSIWGDRDGEYPNCQGWNDPQWWREFITEKNCPSTTISHITRALQYIGNRFGFGD